MGCKYNQGDDKLDMITYTEDVPQWIRDWVDWTAKTILPEWDIYVKMKEGEDIECPDNKGEIEAVWQYSRAFVTFYHSIENNTDGQTRVVHELCHALLGKMESISKSFVTSKTVQRFWEHYENAEEELVVRLSKILVQLRKQQLKKVQHGAT
jgi:hypothetical protein